MKKRILSAIISFAMTILLFISSCQLPISSNRSPQSTFDTFLDKMFLQEITENTINLHFTLAHPEKAGIRNYTVTLGNLSHKTFTDNNARTENYLNMMRQFSKSDLSLKSQLTYDVLADYFQLQLDMAPFFLYEEPLSPSGGIHTQLPLLFEEYTFYDEGDIQDYLQLLSMVDDYFLQIIEFEKCKAAAGLFMPDYVCQAVIDQCMDFIADADEHFLIKTFNSRLENFSDLSQEELEAYKYQNEQLVKINLAKAYQYLSREMSALLGTGNNEQGLCYFPNGKEYYKKLVYYYTGCSDDITEIQKSIQQQRKQDLYDAAKIINDSLDFKNKYNTAILIPKSPADTLLELQTDMLNAFPPAPHTVCNVNIIDECIADYVAPAYYITAPLDAYTQHSIHINADFDTTSIDYFTTLAHEGFPGHLYQTIMSYEADYPAARQLTNYCGYVEGWATYVEMLSYRYANIDTDVAEVMQKEQSALLSLYASTDLGIHYDGWTFEDTLAFWQGYGIDNASVIKEIYEYIVGEPGNYLPYYVGYLEFLKLKEMTTKTYGTDFNEIAFHQTLLDIGPAPFDIIENYFDAYYQKILPLDRT